VGPAGLGSGRTASLEFRICNLKCLRIWSDAIDAVMKLSLFRTVPLTRSGAVNLLLCPPNSPELHRNSTGTLQPHCP
jgi:hypothetical protein